MWKFRSDGVSDFFIAKKGKAFVLEFDDKLANGYSSNLSSLWFVS